MQEKGNIISMDLCSMCSDLFQYSISPIYPVNDLESNCTLCQFILELFLTHPKLTGIDIENARIQLIYPKRRTKHGLYPPITQVVKLIWLWDSSLVLNIAVERNQITHRILRPVEQNRIDYGYIKKLLGTCLAGHTLCNSAFDFGIPKYLKVIDCQTRKLIDAPNEPYVTLSYVWGPLEPRIEKLPGQLPATIEDAITVTMELGFRFLWVDRYCINQEDEDEVFHQIAQMDLIYGRSILTIIASCGDDPHYGLPGVSRPRHFMSHVNSTTHHYQVVSNDETSEIITSNWNKRGWTLQEALFARRRLAFTPYDTYLECMTCGTLESNLSNCSDTNLLIFPQRDSKSALTAVKILKEASDRRLSHSSDVMNAIAGILRAYEANGSGFRHCWGLPIVPHMQFTDIHANMPFVIDIPPRKWTPSVAFICSLGFRFKGIDAPQRRLNFPSWSWCGWHAPVDTFPWDPSGYSEQVFSRGHHAIDGRVEVKLELLDGQTLTLKAYSQLDPLTRQSRLSRFIIITVAATPIRMKISAVGVEIRNQSTRRYCFTIPVHDRREIPTTGFILHVVPTGPSARPEKDRCPIVIIVGKIDGEWERLGVHDLPIPGYDTMTKQFHTIRLG